MKRSVCLVVFAVLAFALCGAGSALVAARSGSGGRPAPERPALRIISLAPSVTEILFAVGAGGRIVGATDYCALPPQAASIPRLGGLIDPNFEAMLAVAPDLAVMPTSHADAARALASLGIPALIVDHASIGGIIESVESIGGAAGPRPPAARLAAEIRARLERVERIARERPRVRALLCIDRPAGRIAEVCIAGKDGFYDALLALAGGRNVYEAAAPLFPLLGAESIVKLDPEVIIEFRAAAPAGESDAAVRSDWQSLRAVSAARAGRIYIFREPFMMIPGPRIAAIAERLLAAIHPEADAAQP
mgnify:FL=1